MLLALIAKESRLQCGGGVIKQFEINQPSIRETSLLVDHFAVSSQELEKTVSRNVVKIEDKQERSEDLQVKTNSEEQMPKETVIEEGFARKMEGRRINSTVYIIEDYMYVKDDNRLGKDRISVRCMHSKRKCKGRAKLEIDTLRIIKISGQHNCDQWMDPDHKIQIQMESKMKHLAMTTEYKLRKIYDDVCLENAAVGSRIPFKRMEDAMRARRNKEKSNLD